MSETSAGDQDDGASVEAIGSTTNHHHPLCVKCLFDWLLSSLKFRSGASADHKRTRNNSYSCGSDSTNPRPPSSKPSVALPHVTVSSSVLPLERRLGGGCVIANESLFQISEPVSSSPLFSPLSDAFSKGKRRRRLKQWPVRVQNSCLQSSASSTNCASLSSSCSLLRLPSWMQGLPTLRTRPRSSSPCSDSTKLNPKNTLFLTTFYILSVFLFLSEFLPACAADSLTLTTSTSTKQTPPHLRLHKNDQSHQHSLSNHQRRREARQQPMPIFRSAEYILGTGPVSNSVYDLPGDSNDNNINVVNDNVAKAAAVTVVNNLIQFNASTGIVKEPPVVWVPYIGIVVIFTVFMVLIVTFWMHIRHSRYRAIQLVKSSPNSEWNEIQPGRWEASYGGHVYTVNQINQTRVLGAIAAAAAAAMGQGVRQVWSANQADETGDSQAQDSSLYNTTVAEVEDDDEHTRLLVKHRQADQSPSYRSQSSRNNNSASIIPASNPNSTRNVTVPISDSVWLLTEEQLIESIRTGNGSHKSTPVPTPTTATTATVGDGASTSASSVTSSVHRSRVPPPVPPRVYGTFSLPGHATNAQDAAAKLGMAGNTARSSTSSSHARVSVQKSLPISSGEIPLDTIAGPSRKALSSASSTGGVTRHDEHETASTDMLIMESEDVCGDLPIQQRHDSTSGGTAGAVGWINESFSSDTGDDYFSPTMPLSLDEMTLPEPEPWTPNAGTTYTSPTPARSISSRMPMQRASNASSASLGTQGAQGGAVSGGINILQGRRISAARGSVRGRGRGPAGRGQMSSLIAYSNMSKKKGGFIIPRG